MLFLSSMYPLLFFLPCIMRENAETGMRLFIFRGYHQLQMYVVIHYYGPFGMMRNIKERIPCFCSVFIHFFHNTFLSAPSRTSIQHILCIQHLFLGIFLENIEPQINVIFEYKYNKKTLWDYLDCCASSHNFLLKTKYCNEKITTGLTTEQH